VPIDETIAHWCSAWYTPVMQAIREQGILKHFPGQTETDLYLRVMDHLHFRRQENQEMDVRTATADFAARYGSREDGDGFSLDRFLDGVARLLKLK
jgi:hypothetical protein